MVIAAGITAAPSGEGQLGVSLSAPVRDRLSFAVGSGLLRAGGIKLQDIRLSAPIQVVNKEAWTVQVAPGLTLPMGSIAPALGIAPAATGSIDPRLGLQVVGGSLWAVSGRFVARAPLVGGLDDVRQGPSGLAELSGARRLSKGVVWAGSGLVKQYPGESGLELTDVSAIVGGLWNVSESSAITARLRVPVWTSGEAYTFAAGIEANRVFGRRPEPEH